MKITCDKSELLAGVNIALKAVSTKTTASVLECILIDAAQDEIRLTANDTELGIETKVKGEILTEGSVAINAKIFSDIVRKLPDNQISIETDNEYLTKIVCEKAKFEILGRAPEDFITLPAIERNNGIRISQFTLKEMIRQTIFSIGDSDTNKIMSGELFEVKGNTLRVVALDGHRIALRKEELKESYDDINAIVPGKTLNEIIKIVNGEIEDEMMIYIKENHIVFEFDDTVAVSRLIEGPYYNIEKMLSGDYETKVLINKKEMLSCIDRSTLLIKEGDKKPIIITIGDDTMEFSIQSFIGTMNETIEIQKDGRDLMIGFNPKFLMDALKAIDDEEVSLYFLNPQTPCFIRNEEESYIYLILPVNFNVAGR